MTIAPEQRTIARLAGIVILARFVLAGPGDSVTIRARGRESRAERARLAAEEIVLWRFALLSAGLAWITIGILAWALHAGLER